MTTPTQPSSSMPKSPPERLPLRLQLTPTMGDGALDGSWWPQSRDLVRELPDLVDNFPTEHGRVQRVVFSRPDWDTAPHRVRVGRGVIKVGSYPRYDTHQVWLSMSTHKLIRLAVQEKTDPVDSVANVPPARKATDDRAQAEHWKDGGGAWRHAEPVRGSKQL